MCVVWLVKKNVSVFLCTCMCMYVVDLCMLTYVRVNGWVDGPLTLCLPFFLLICNSKIKA